MLPAIINLDTDEIVYEGIDYIDCFDTLRHHFMQNMSAPGRYQVIDADTMEKIDYAEIRRIQQSVKNAFTYGG